jgi:hypothetical protein|uniref:Uncharacterized protein n=1 Tax=uncultured prokaryote TaxID=198431 RepID=A0A0H5PVH3_9ZZZZ|nr:hypothetical protein [uncultured prokaryote]
MLLLLDLRYKDKKNFRCYQMVHGIKKLSLNLTPFGLPISPCCEASSFPSFFEDEKQAKKAGKRSEATH